MKGNGKMKSANIQLETLVCPSCTQKIEAALKNIDGIDQDSLKLSFSSSKVKFDFDDNATSIEAIEKAINRVGFEVIKSRVK